MRELRTLRVWFDVSALDADVVLVAAMPSIISGNLHAAVLMMAEKVADAMRGRPPLPPSRAPVYTPASLSAQR